MASKAMTRRPRFNPTEYKEDFMDLMKVNPKLAADSATKLAKTKRNQDDELHSSDMATKELVAFLGTSLVMAAAGWQSAGWMAKRDALIADWETEGAESVGATITDTPEPWDHEQGVKDPTHWWFIPKLMAYPLGFGALALISASMRKRYEAPSGFERFATLSAQSTFGLMIAQMVAGWSYKSKEKKLAKLTDLSSVKPLAPANGGMQPTGT
jgi:hypothetical protein